MMNDATQGAAQDSEMKCISCGEPTTQEESTECNKTAGTRRCKTCTAIASRLFRMRKKNGDLVKGFEKLNAAERKKFMADAKNLFGDDLAHKLNEAVVQCSSERSSLLFRTTGKYFDEADIRERYKLKPDVAQRIIENGKSFMCPVKQILMYEDPEYVSVQEDEESNVNEKKRKSEAETNYKPKKAPKSSKGKGKGGRGGDDEEIDEQPKVLTEKNKKTFDEQGAKLAELQNQLALAKAEVDAEVMAMIPRWLVDNVDAADEALKTLGQEVEKILEEGQCKPSTSSSILASVKDMLSKTTGTKKQFQKYVKDSEKELKKRQK